MLILRLWNYLRGYVIILVEGYFPEKFLNICISRGIFLWDIKRQKSCIITMKIGIPAFIRIKSVAKKTGCRVKILSKRGMPFTFHKYRKRKTFVVGCAIFVGMVYFLSSFVWTVELTGNKAIPADKIIQNLAVVGLKPGLWKPALNSDKICNQMMINMKELAWISVDVSGTRAIVDVAERSMPPKLIDKDVPCNIVADRDGIIQSIFVKAGSPVVEVGASVKKGDILVAGMVESSEKVARFVHALADIKARTWYEASINIPLETQKVKKTGKSKNSYRVNLFGWGFDIGSKKPSYKSYETKIQIHNVAIGKDYIFPFGIAITNYSETTPAKEILSVEKARQIAITQVWKLINSQMNKNVKILDKRVYYYTGKNYVRTRILVEATQKIGSEELINK